MEGVLGTAEARDPAGYLAWLSIVGISYHNSCSRKRKSLTCRTGTHGSLQSLTDLINQDPWVSARLAIFASSIAQGLEIT